MRRVRRALLPLLTAVLIAGGAALPYVSAVFQDRRLEGQQEVWSFDPVGLRLGNEPEVWPALAVIAGGYEWLNWDGETNLTAEDARAAAREAAALLEKSGLAEAGTAAVSRDEVWAEPALLVSSGARGLSAVVWNCYWDVYDAETERGMFCNLFLDDNTGKMITAALSSPDFQELEDVYAQMENWRVFLSDYYGLEVEVLGEREPEKWAAAQATDGPEPVLLERRFILGFDLGEELGKQKLWLHLLNGITAFNS